MKCLSASSVSKRVDPKRSASYNKQMKFIAIVLLGLSVVSFAGCSSKNSQRADSGGILAEEAESNPILFEEEYEAAKKGELPKFDIPVVRNQQVEMWLDYFQGRGKKWMVIWLGRSRRYVPFMKKILREHDLPQDLVNLAMIESGFSSRAYSRARAVGPWQFMKATGRLYGLQVNFWVDERRDPEKSTVAAARHLKDLYDQFQSWKLAAAAYNAGAGKVTRAIRKYKTEDFWELTKGRYLKPETRHYVPKMIAAALIAKEPEKYGFTDIQYEEPLEYDKVVLRKPVNLVVLSERAGVSLEEMLDLNPELNHPVTPPNSAGYELRVPAGRSDLFIKTVASLSEDERAGQSVHRVKRGENITKLAQIYKVPAKQILSVNGVKSIRQGMDIVIPRPLDDQLASIGARSYRDDDRRRRPRRGSRKQSMESVYPKSQSQTQSSADSSEGSKKKIHIVRRGETLWDIAQLYGTTVSEIKKVNGIKRGRNILPGKRLHVPA